MTFENYQLQTVLNYDTHGRNCLSFEQRLEIHKAISQKMSYGRAVNFTGKFRELLVSILHEINEIGYRTQSSSYIEDHTGAKVLRTN